ncbi:MAG: ABC transporter permease, partial [Methylocystaceae bacterium]
MTMFSGHAAGAFWIVLRYEGSLLWRDRSLPIAVALLTLLLGGGLYNGLLQVGQKDALLETLQQEQGRRFAELNEELKKIEAGQRPDIYRNPATPLQLLSGLGESYAIMPSVAPAPLALG